MVWIHRQPCFWTRREACLSAWAPLHWSAFGISASLSKLVRILQAHRISAQIIGNEEVPHCDLVSLVDHRSAWDQVEERIDSGCQDCIIVHAVHQSVVVMIAKHPVALITLRLCSGIGCDGISDNFCGCEIIGTSIILAQDLKVEWHIELGSIRRSIVLHEIIEGSIDLTKDHTVFELIYCLPPALDDLMIPRVILREVVHHAIPNGKNSCARSVEGLVSQLWIFEKEGHGINAEASDPQAEPKPQHLLHCLYNFRIPIIEVRLELTKGMIVELLRC
mmetsp:Transcript_58786/g.137266  ORF Transcript_58786/g.137266 Transcript_58786/m.137266 type:complete len:277 (-) Transcript_58786:596-1426(-)